MAASAVNLENQAVAKSGSESKGKVKPGIVRLADALQPRKSKQVTKANVKQHNVEVQEITGQPKDRALDIGRGHLLAGRQKMGRKGAK